MLVRGRQQCLVMVCQEACASWHTFKDGEIFSGGVARGRQKSFEKALEQLMNYLEEEVENLFSDFNRELSG